MDATADTAAAVAEHMDLAAAPIPFVAAPNADLRELSTFPMIRIAIDSSLLVPAIVPCHLLCNLQQIENRIA
jgi:hypothetical protein